MIKISTKNLVPGALLSLLALPISSFAQEADDGAGVQRADNTTISEILVTARRRDESIQDVPAAVSALAGDMLENIAAFGLEDFTRLAPGLALADSGFYGFKQFRIRGVATGTGASVLQSPVAVYFDEVQTVDPFVPLSTLDLYLTDINRVEVLRGPQGTLFGSSALSGAIRIMPNRPDNQQVSASLSATFESVKDGEEGSIVEGMVNTPLGEDSALRLVAYSREVPGWIDNIEIDKEDGNSGDVWGVRGAFSTRLGENLDVLLSGAYQEDDFDDTTRTFMDGEGDPREWSVLTPDSREGDGGLASLVLDWYVGKMTLTSVTSYLSTNYKPRSGSDGFSELIGFPGTPTWQDLDSDNENWVQEFRLASSGEGRINYILGAHYSDRDVDIRGLFQNPVAEEVLGLDNLLDTQLTATIEELALFGELTVGFGGEFEAGVAFRAFDNDFESTQRSFGLFTEFVPSVISGDNSDTDVVPRFTLQWMPNDNLTLYSQIAKGYRIGQSNTSLDAVQGTVPAAFDSDELWNYEVGFKGSFIDQRLQAAVALYFIEWDNMQVRLPGPTSPYTGNAGSSEIVGLESEISFVITRNLQLINSIAWTDAELTEDLPTVSQPGGEVGASSGDPLPGTPDLTVSTALQYTAGLGSLGELFLRVDHQYVGEALNAFTDVGYNEFGDYHLINLSAVYEHPSNVGVTLYVKNLTDDDSMTNVIDGQPTFNVPNQAIRLQPRTIGLTVQKRF